MNGESTHPLKSRMSTVDGCREPARSIKAIDPAAPASSARRAVARSPGIQSYFGLVPATSALPLSRPPSWTISRDATTSPRSVPVDWI